MAAATLTAIASVTQVSGREHEESGVGVEITRLACLERPSMKLEHQSATRVVEREPGRVRLGEGPVGELLA